MDEAYAALRDLKCEVQFVTIKGIEPCAEFQNVSMTLRLSISNQIYLQNYLNNSEDGQVEEAFETFGAKREGQPNRFNPVYDEDKDFDLRVQNEARAPFALDNLRPFAANSAAK